MKRFFLLLCLATGVFAGAARAAESPDDLYVSIYQLIQQADSYKESGQPKAALEKYLEAQDALKKMQSTYPTWNDKLVKYRLTYLADKIAPLATQFPGTQIPAKKSETAEVKPDAAPTGIENQISTLNDELVKLRTEKALVEAKLREALSAQPRAADPREMAKAEEKIAALEKERDLEKVSLEQERKNLAKQNEAATSLAKERDSLQQKLKAKEDKSEVRTLRAENDALRKETSDLNKRVATVPKVEDLNNKVKLAQSENDKLRQQITAADKASKSENDALRKQLADANKSGVTQAKVDELNNQVKLARNENDKLRQQVTSTEKSAKAENEALRKQLADAGKSNVSQAKVDELNNQVKLARSENDKLRQQVTTTEKSAKTENEALRKQLADASKSNVSQSKLNDLNNQVKKTEAENEKLKQQVTATEKSAKTENEALRKQLADASKSNVSQSKLNDLNNQVKKTEAENEKLKKQVTATEKSAKTENEALRKQLADASKGNVSQSKLNDLSNQVKKTEAENEKLKLQVTATEKSAKTEVDALKKQLADASKGNVSQSKLNDLSNQVKKTEAENDKLKQQVTATEKSAKTENEALKKQVAELSKSKISQAKVDELNTQVKQARSDNEKLRQQLADAEKKNNREARAAESAEMKQIKSEVKTLQAKNEELQKENKKLESLLTDPGTQTASATARIASLQKDKASLEKEKNALEKDKSALEKEKSALEKHNASDAAKLKVTERERDDLEKKLASANRELDKKSAAPAPKSNRNSEEVTTLRARIAAYEAKAIPYTAEEQALFKKAETTPSVTDKKPAKSLPSGAATLIADAQRAFAARRLDEAEKKYLQVLSLDEKNVFTLANLAAIQVEQNRLDEAEVNVKKALALDSNDAYSLSLLGLVKFRQDKADEAIDALSRSVQLDPKNAESQNYLGLALSQKGERGPAEAAFRKAIQLSPNYGSAHHNLAIHYATQKPPSLELARWHYQKAITAGHAKNPDLEKLLNGK